MVWVAWVVWAYLGLAVIVLPRRERGGVGRSRNGTVTGTREVDGEVYVEGALAFTSIRVYGVVGAGQIYGSSGRGGGFTIQG